MSRPCNQPPVIGRSQAHSQQSSNAGFASPEIKAASEGQDAGRIPLDTPRLMYDAIDNMPSLVTNIERAIGRHTGRMEAKNFKSEIPDASIASALIFARDAICSSTQAVCWAQLKRIISGNATHQNRAINRS